MPQPVHLRRSLNLPVLIFYGLGTIVGGGFYALVGKVVGHAGWLTPLAFLVASGIALFSALSYAELSSRFPLSAGEAHYVLVASRRIEPAALVGWAVVATGVVSAATLADAFAGFVRTLTDVPEWLVVAVMVVGLGVIAISGINWSAGAALIITVLELAGLVIVIAVAASRLPDAADRWAAAPAAAAGWGVGNGAWVGVLLGAYLAFYSFVGFEDMVNVAEEVKRPERNLPIAIMVSLLVTTLLYVLVTSLVIAVVDQKQLVNSDSPLSLVFRAGGWGAISITLIGMLSGINGALVQIVMASRVLYGMAERRGAPRIFSRIHPRTQTPIIGTLFVSAAVLALAWWLPIVALAKVTSTILLAIYAAVNLSLIVLKRRQPTRTAGWTVPLIVPLIGFALCVTFILFHALAR